MNYVIARYDVTDDGSNLSARVQQFDATRDPHGYWDRSIAPIRRCRGSLAVRGPGWLESQCLSTR